MDHFLPRRWFLAEVGRGTLLATLGPVVACDLGFAPQVACAEESDIRLEFGSYEPLVAFLQETPIDALQTQIVRKLADGTSLKDLVGSAALANARTFGGEDYIGFHTFMALSPSLRMSSRMPKGEEALPILKVLYRNTHRIQDVGGRSQEVLRSLDTTSAGALSHEALQQAVHHRKITEAEVTLSRLVGQDPQLGLEALLPLVAEYPEVHRTVLPYRAWDMQQMMGTKYALTFLRQSLRYCVKAQPAQVSEWSQTGKMLINLLDEFQLEGKVSGTKPLDDGHFLELSKTFSTASPLDSAQAAATALAEGFYPHAIGEAISLAATQLVLRDCGRLPQWEDRLKPAGSVHGDSVGVHACDSANAWRNLARVSTGRSVFACIIIGAWQVARDREASGNHFQDPLPYPYHLSRLQGLDADGLLARLKESIQNNLQANAAAIVHRYGEQGFSETPVFDLLLRYAVSEDGALHAEKYFSTVWDDFHETRPSVRWQHLVALARVTASEFGKPAAGQREARELLGLENS
jgi:hypothetical protein